MLLIHSKYYSLYNTCHDIKRRSFSFLRKKHIWHDMMNHKDTSLKWRTPLSKSTQLRAHSPTDSTVYKSAWAEEDRDCLNDIRYSVISSPLLVNSQKEEDAWKSLRPKVTERVSNSRVSATMLDRYLTNAYLRDVSVNTVETPRSAPYIKRGLIDKGKTQLETISSTIARRLRDNEDPQLRDKFKVNYEKCLGKGRQGVVSLAAGIDQFIDVEAAVKTCAKYSKLWKIEDIGSVRREAKVMKKLGQHQNLPKLYGVFESPMNIHIVTEVLRGGDLFSYLNRHDFAQQDENETRNVMKALLEVVKYCHDKNILHLDIKLENIMLRKYCDHLDPSSVVLIDFGHARELPVDISKHSCHTFPTGTLKRPVGSPSYTAPEVVLENCYSSRSDMWSLGVVTYVLLQGYLPFPHLQSKNWIKFRATDYTAAHLDPFRYAEDWAHLSPHAVDFVARALTFDSEHRITIDGALKHPWMLNTVETSHESATSPVKEEAEEKPFFRKFW